MANPERPQVFISDRHEHVEWLKRRQTMLRPLTRYQTITAWHDTSIRARNTSREQVVR